MPGENPLTSLEASFRAVSRAPTAITMKNTPGQSILVPSRRLALTGQEGDEDLRR